MAVVGIDLGTTNTVVAAVRANRAAVVRDSEDRHLIPSVVSFHPNGDVLVGHPARARRVIDAANTVYSIKRLIGRSWNTAEVTLARERFPFELREGPGHAALVVARGETFTLPEVSAFVLRQAKRVGEASVADLIDRAVITVPANFNDLQRTATKVAGRIAGLEVLRILNEPTAAALAYGYGKRGNERLVIYDFGGGTFDVTILDLSENVFEVLATAGDTFLGGDDIDELIAERMAEHCLKKHRFDPREDRQSFEKLRLSAERVKIALSSNQEHSEFVPEIGYAARGKAVDLHFTMTRKEFESLAEPVIDRTFDVCKQALDVARLTVGAFDQIVLVGGSTRSPLVARRVGEFFGRKPLDRINPEEVVAVGACIQAHALAGGERRRRPIPRPPMPASRPPRHAVAAPPQRAPNPQHQPAPPTRRRTTASGLGAPPAPRLPRRESPPRIPSAPPPRSAAATERRLSRPAPEASYQAEPLAPPLGVFSAPEPPPAASSISPASAAPPTSVQPLASTPLLIDVTPLSLVVETVSGFCDVLIQRNTPVPCEQSRTFATTSDSQTVVRVRVGQGESKRFDDNTLLGALELAGLPPGPRGSAQVVVTFTLDGDGILDVVASDAATGRATSARLRLLGAADHGGSIPPSPLA